MRARARCAEEQLQLIGECRKSGLTIAEWCRREGIRPDTYYTWVDRLKRRGLLESEATIPQRIVREYAPDIVKVTVEQPAAMTNGLSQAAPSPLMADYPEPTTASKGAVMEVALGAVRIKVTNQVNPQLLAQTIQLIGGSLGC